MNSIQYKLLLILSLVLSAAAQTAAAADNSRYRVELIVFTHLGHNEQPRETRRLEDYSAALDLLAPPAGEESEGAAPAEVELDAETIAEATAETETSSVTPAETLPAADAGTGEADEGSAVPDPETDPWNTVVHLPELGERMQDAWRRLRLSEPYRPLQYLAWEQGGDAPFPTVRVRDLEVILTVDPRAESPTAPAPQDVAATPGQGLVDASAPVPGDVAEAPPPIRYYRLDGTASLTRSRFLHLSVAVELREPIYGGATPDGAAPRSSGAQGGYLSNSQEATGEPAPTGFLLHRLEQSRVVGTERMEYFDGPALGVLAWVTDISETVVEGRAE